MQLRRLAFVMPLLFIVSCENTWDSETKDMFHKSCMEDALTWAPNQDKARTYCDCVLERTMAKYPNMSDALENIDSVISDPKIGGCKETIVQ